MLQHQQRYQLKSNRPRRPRFPRRYRVFTENSPGDAIKIEEANGVTIRRVRVEWTNGPDENDGAYGLYLVQTRNVLIGDCEVRGASDAGVYVGQSENTSVRRNYVYENVNGIEAFGDTIADNNSIGALILSYYFIDPKVDAPKNHDPVPEKTHLHDNTMRGAALTHKISPGLFQPLSLAAKRSIFFMAVRT